MIHASVNVDDWEIGLLLTDEQGLFVASLDSPSRHKQIEIRGKGYRGLLKQACHLAGLHVGLATIVAGHEVIGGPGS